MSYSSSVILCLCVAMKYVLASRWLAMDYSYLLSRKYVLARRWLAMDYSGLLSWKHVLASRWLAMDYSGFQASYYNMYLPDLIITRR
jgi:hypothetical protein